MLKGPLDPRIENPLDRVSFKSVNWKIKGILLIIFYINFDHVQAISTVPWTPDHIKLFSRGRFHNAFA